MLSLMNNANVERVMNAVAAGTTSQTSSAVDCKDCDGVSFVAAFGVISANAVTSVKVQQSDDDGASDAYSDLEGTLSSVLTPTTDNNKCLVVEIVRPRKRYLKLVVNRSTGNAVIDGVVAIKHHMRSAPPPLHSTVAGREVFASPNEGTA